VRTTGDGPFPHPTEPPGWRSERRLCEEVHLNLWYRWFCRLGLDGGVPDHSTFSKTRHGRFRDADLLCELFETAVRRCMAEGLVGGEGFAVGASLIAADAHRQRGVETPDQLDPKANRAVTEYLATLDDAAFGAATPVEPKFISPIDPAARWTASWGGPAVYAYCTNYLIYVEHAVIVDVEPSTAVRQAEVTAAKTMIERTHDRFEVCTPRMHARTPLFSLSRPGLQSDSYSWWAIIADQKSETSPSQYRSTIWDRWSAPAGKRSTNNSPSGALPGLLIPRAARSSSGTPMRCANW
jgi:hypothetical protein